MERQVEKQDWIDSWHRHHTPFHIDYVNKMLEKHASVMVDGRSSIRIFVPLCGKSVDMKWLSDQGHTVIGVELAQKAVEDFFQEQGVTFTTQSLSQIHGTLYQSEDKKIQLYCCDLFDISQDLVGQVDAVWDRGSWLAINHRDRDRYLALMQSLMTPDCKYLLSALHYDHTKFSGPPHNFSDEDIQKYFGQSNVVKRLDSVKVEDENFTNWGLDWCMENTFLISPNHG